ncbi:MAG: T9SS type A sorting domain-containing protein [Bacteroidota bacterium]
MKKLPSACCLVVLLLLNAKPLLAQLTITSGAQFTVSGNAQLTLANTDLVNNGNLVTGSGTISFTGSSPSGIGGNQSTRFYNLQVNKSPGISVSLLKPVIVDQQIIFTSGFLDLNGFDANLGTTGSLGNEQESSHIIGANGGNVIFNTALNAPSSANPGNLGIMLTSTQNFGNTIIKRGQQSQTNSSNSGNSILRYYDITPANNTSLNATVRVQYFDSELNGLDENLLNIYTRDDGVHWISQGFDTRNTSTNYVEKTGINSFSRLTLSSVNNALPLHFLSFATSCNGNKTIISWKTAQEINTSHFEIESSTDGIRWNNIGSIPSTGNGNTTGENNYSFTDNNPQQNGYYRVASYDLDGRVLYTELLRNSCNNDEMLRVWPNPVSDVLYISMPSALNSGAAIKLFDGKGALVQQRAAKLVQGNNLLSIAVKGMASGLYYITIQYAGGQLQTKKIMKE